MTVLSFDFVNLILSSPKVSKISSSFFSLRDREYPSGREKIAKLGVEASPSPSSTNVITARRAQICFLW